MGLGYKRHELEHGGGVQFAVDVNGIALRIDRPSGTGLPLYETLLLTLAEAKVIWPLMRDACGDREPL